MPQPISIKSDTGDGGNVNHNITDSNELVHCGLLPSLVWSHTQVVSSLQIYCKNLIALLPTYAIIPPFSPSTQYSLTNKNKMGQALTAVEKPTPTVTLYKVNEPGGYVSVIVFDARRNLSKDQLSLLANQLRDNMPWNVVDAIYDPPEIFPTGVAFKAVTTIDKSYLPYLETLITTQASMFA